MSNHTPGPWHYGETDNGFAICQHTPKADFYFAEIIGLDDQSKSDARLIAAAPDLLEALKALIFAAGNLHPSDDSFWVAIKAADAAVAKAEGTS